MEYDTICQLVRQAEDNYVSGTSHISKYVDHSLYETVERIMAYLNSIHISGAQDSLGREKPFFNIVTAAVNIWYRATDLDRKNMRIRSSKKRDQVKAFMATIFLRQWMKKVKFGVFLNQWGRTLCQFGSAVVKFVEKDGELYAQTIPWNRIIIDSIDFKANPKVEKLYYTPAQLRENPLFDIEQVNNLIDSGYTAREGLDGQNKDTQSNYILVYEVHGNLPLSMLTDEEKDKDIYRQQMHVVSFVETKAGEYNDYTLYRGKESKDPYMLTHLIEEDNRALAIGAVESLFDSQWMVNHSVKQMKDTLDISSKLIFQTADTFYAGRNVLNALETGDILIHRTDMPLTQVNNSKPDITAMQNFASQWRLLSQEITSTPDALRGTTLPSGTPYSLGAYLGGQAGTLFEQMTENKGLALEDMLREYIIPHLQKKLNHADEIAATLEDYDLAQIDSIYLPYQAVKQFNERTNKQLFSNIQELVSGGSPQPLDQFNPQAEQQNVQQNLATQGANRYFTPDEIGKLTWKEYFKDFEWDCDVEITNEAIDKQATMQTLASMLQTAVNNPEMYKLIMSKILDESGIISPLEIKTAVATQQPMQPPQQPAPLSGG